MLEDATSRAPIQDLSSFMKSQGEGSSSLGQSHSSDNDYSDSEDNEAEEPEDDEDNGDERMQKRPRTESPEPHEQPLLGHPFLRGDSPEIDVSPTASQMGSPPHLHDVPSVRNDDEDRISSSSTSSSSSSSSSKQPQEIHNPDAWMREQREHEEGAVSVNPASNDGDDTPVLEPVQPPLPFCGELPEEAEIPPSRIDHIEIVNQFIRDIRGATLEGSGLPDHVIDALTNPQLPDNGVDEDDPQFQSQLTNEDERFQLDVYLATSSASESVYNGVASAHNRRYPNTPLKSLYLARQHVEMVTGVAAIEDDMCINSCLAFVGPFKDHTTCPTCGESRTKLDDKNRPIPRRKATTLPLGPQLQAVIRSELGSKLLQYRHSKTLQVLARLSSNRTEEDKLKDVYDDIFCSQDYIDLYKKEKLTEDDILVGFSIDGAQLYQKKESDTWIAVWVVQNYDPKVRFKRKYVLPALVVPGPKKPKNIDSFMYRGFHHLSALQRMNDGNGMRAYNAQKKAITQSRIFLYLGTADAVALTEIDGRVGHHGANGCRIGCPMKGRHKPNAGHYYAAHSLPNNYTVATCQHPDVNVATLDTPTPEIYKQNLQLVTQTHTQTAFEEARLKTGISKPSILSGLKYLLPIPRCFSVDLMHLLFINCGELLIPLWRGTLSHDKTDHPSTWPWRCLVDDTWIQHGKLVAAATKYFPTLFHRPPRNPAEKINSGYKATEYYLYIFGLGPAFFRTILPADYWSNFCSLVRGVRIITGRSITAKQLFEAHHHFVQFVKGYELLYYQRRVDRLHFCRPWIHTLLHTVSETMRVGPGTYYTQFTTERAIGYLGGEIRQSADPFANLARIAERQAQQNALKVIYPELDPPKPLPRGASNIGNGYILLPPRSRTVDVLAGAVGALLRDEYGSDTLRIWGKLWIPQGHKVRSLYSERKSKRENTRISRNAIIRIDNSKRFAEVQFYFLADEKNLSTAKAVVSLYSEPNHELLEQSKNTLYACSYHGPHSLRIIPISSIISLISMQPMPAHPGERDDLWFPVEKSGLEDGEITGYTDDLYDESDNEDED
ncbi:hypothetical protein CC1G_11002 [Coprinopsis cinerea okayama7|uniref:Transposase domain-containing protein n=1 Tax=Coprinopsis cinerea (strain Okayama-7 / 130 / ATCC MYA-4618 / FGSC 9003) TaxID=240176 RepID=A8P732_COPC7|nr:hypothetical protein CC1G_11002 [Coprinopsis cinerea okayama7\|eukprot:XP_001839280.2 hypothetical protein CC1G_11002 [Coprinopsis cinerea okayama7\